MGFVNDRSKKPWKTVEQAISEFSTINTVEDLRGLANQISAGTDGAALNEEATWL